MNISIQLKMMYTKPITIYLTSIILITSCDSNVCFDLLRFNKPLSVFDFMHLL